MTEGVLAVDPQLRFALTSSLGDRGIISSIERRPSSYHSSFLLDEILVRLDDGTTTEFVAKAIHRNAMSPEAHRAKPRFVWDQERERATYESLLSPLDVDSARYFGSYEDSAGIRYLLLERVVGAPLWQFGEFEAWCAAARWLARMHARVGFDAARSSRAGAHLLWYDRQFYDRWMRRARTFADPDDAAVVSLARRHPGVVEWLIGQPLTFIHGEFYASNVLVEAVDPSAFVVRPIDWEMAALGPALMDLACLLAGNWTDDERAQVADAYHSESVAAGGDLPLRNHYLKTLDCCLIHLSVRNLGWSRDWSPPLDRDHDWLSEALRLCERWRL